MHRVQLGVFGVKRPSGLLSLAGGLVALALAASPAAALLTISGTLSSGRWTTADSLVRVTGNIVLPSDSTLDIEPGVRVEFTGPFSFTVRGVLDAAGAPDSLLKRPGAPDSLLKKLAVVFTSASPGVDSLRWKGIRFEQAQRGNRLHFVRVEHGWARGEWPLNCGGGIYIESCSPTITRSEIVGNRADFDGGGIYGWFTTATFQNLVIASNSCANFGGGAFVAYSSPSFINCTIALDSAGGWGGGVFVGAESQPVFVNCIITHNSQQLWGDRLPPGDAFTSNLGRTQSATPSVSFSAVGMVPLTPYPGAGNIFSDPQFLRPDALNFHLKPSSPCVDAGDPKFSARAEPDSLINRIDVGAYGGTSEASPSVPVIYNDLADLRRTVNFDTIRIASDSINSVAPREIRIENRGHFNLFLREFRFSSEAFYPDSAVKGGVLLPAYLAAPIEPGKQAKFTLFFRPTELRTYQDSLLIISNDPDTVRDTLVLKLKGTGINPVAVLDTLLLFGRARLGADTTRSLYVRNTGDSPLSVRFAGPQADGFEVTVVRATVSPRDSGEVRVKFHPLRPETYEASAAFETNDRNLFVHLSGRGAGSKMVIADSARFIGYVYRGATDSIAIKVKNEGDSLLFIRQAQVSDTLAFSAHLPADADTIAPDSAANFANLTIRFHPPGVGLFNALLVVRSNYPFPDTVRLSGEGMAAPGRYVFGHVSGVWGWGPGSPDYVVRDSVYVPPNERLKIEPGARIRFEPRAFLQADGELRAVGLPGDSIMFLPRDTSGVDSLLWRGITLVGADASRLAYCVVRGSREGVTIREASPRIQFSTIADNGDSARIAGGSEGGGFYLENSGAIITGCIIERNRAALGGGLYVLNSKPTVTNCVIRDNQAGDGAAIYMRFLAGGLYQSNLAYGNRPDGTAGAITAVDRCTPRIVNCTIADNVGSGLLATDRSVGALINSIVWGSGRAIDLRGGGNILVSFSDVEGGFQGNQNLDTLPGFDPNSLLGYDLAENSPLIDRGNPESSYRDYSFPPSKKTWINDIGAYGGPLGGSWETPEVWISLFQNPAFPQWLDILVGAETTFTVAPICSVEFSAGTMTSVALSKIDARDSLIYRGSVEARREGTIFLLAKATFHGGRTQKVGRTFELKLLTGQGGGVYVAGLGGWLTVPPEAVRSDGWLMTTPGVSAVKPELGFLPVSAAGRIVGLKLNADRTAELSIPVESSFAPADVARLGTYRRTEGGWVRLPGGYRGGQVVGKVDGDGEFVLALGDAPLESVLLPSTIRLVGAYPNPFNGGVTIAFELPTPSDVKLTLYDLTGRTVRQLIAAPLAAGLHRAVWDGASATGMPLPSGVYWARLEVGGAIRSTKLLLLR